MGTKKTREILDQIDRDRTELLRSTEGLGTEALDSRTDAEPWSISDVLHHLALSEEATAKLLSRMLEQAREQRLPSDPSPESSVLKRLDAVVSGADRAKAVAPARVTPRSHVSAAEAVDRLEASRKRVVSAVDELSEYDVSSLTFPHPFFGPLDVYQWVLVTGWHERRHRGQIERLRAVHQPR